MNAFLIADMRRIDKAAAICRPNGFGLETQVLLHDDLRGEEWLARHKNLMLGLSPLALHCPFDRVDPGSGDDNVQDFTRQQLTWAVDVAGQLDVKHLIVHGGRPGDSDDFHRWLERAVAFWWALLAEAPDNLRFYIENTPLASVQQVLDLVSAIDSPRVKMNLDVGHAHCEPGRSVVEWIQVLGDRIGYSHLHSNDGQADLHQGLGDATLPAADVCGALNAHAPQAIWSLEVDAGAFVSSLEWLEQNDFLPGPITIPQNLPD